MLVPFDGTLYTYSNEETNRNRKKVQKELTYAVNCSVRKMNIKHVLTLLVSIFWKKENRC